MTLTVPDIAPEDDTLTAALAYASAGWYLLPVERGSKKPGSIVGNNWHTKSSRDPKTIAAWFVGTDHGIALHVGRSGAVVLDVDTPNNLPAVILEALQVSPPPAQTTRTGDTRRAHYIYTQPAGRILGNGTGQLGGTWGEIRGLNGVIIVTPSLHADAANGGLYTWGRTGPVPPLPESLAALLHDSTNATDCATDTAVAAFITQHTTSSRPELLEGWQRLFAERAKAGESRHDRMLSVLTGALKEAATGHLAAGATITALRTDFITATTSEPVGRQGHARKPAEAGDEFHGILSWAVAQANAADPIQTRERLARTQPTVGPPPSRHLRVAPAGDEHHPTGTDGPTIPQREPNERPPLTVIDSTTNTISAIATYYGASENGTALALVHLEGDTIRYCPERGRWLHWDGSRWEWDTAEVVREKILTIAALLPEDSAWKSHKHRALSAAGVTGIARQAQTKPAIVVRLAQLDARPLELNTPGGIVNLRTGQLQPPDPASLHTRLTTCTPDAAADQSVWLRFLDQTFASSPEMIDYMQRLLGYSATGEIRDHVLPFAAGEGQNGKGATLEAALKVLGDYATTAPNAFLMAKIYDGHDTEIARLVGTRMVLCSEIDQDARFDEAKVKQLTGGDTLTAHFMRQDYVTFAPTHKLWLMGNHKPAVRAGGYSFWRRLRLIPFNHTVAESDRVDNLQGILSSTHGPAVLAWIIAGAVRYLRDGLQDPDAVKVATAEYAKSEDTIARFVDEACRIGGGQMIKQKVNQVREAYEHWCHTAGETAVNAKSLSAALKRDHDVLVGIRSHGERFYGNLSLIREDEER